MPPKASLCQDGICGTHQPYGESLMIARAKSSLWVRDSGQQFSGETQKAAFEQVNTEQRSG